MGVGVGLQPDSPLPPLGAPLISLQQGVMAMTVKKVVKTKR